MIRTKIIAALLACAMIFSAACAGSQNEKKDNENAEKNKVQVEESGKDEEHTDKDISKDTDEEITEKDVNKKEDPKPQATGQQVQTPPSNGGNIVMNGTLFIGDSRTEGLMIYGGISGADFFCAKSMTIDRINKGERVHSAGRNVSVYEMLSSGTYDRVYISVGLNELGWAYIDKFINEYRTLIHNVREKQPSAVIYVQALYPVTEAKSASGSIVNNNQICWYNSNIYSLAASEGARYINTDAPLINSSGALMDEATTDGVHLKAAYYKALAAYISEITM